MLKVLRENLKYLSWILWVVIAVFVLFIFLDFGSGVGAIGAGGRQAAATVGSSKISRAEFQRQYQLAENQYRQIYGAQFTPELAKQLRLPLQVLNQMVSQRILLDEARRLGLDVSDEEVRRQILEMPAFKDATGRFVGDEVYRRILGSVELTPDTFELQMREEMLVQKLRDALRANLWVGDQEIERAYRDEVERAKIKYVLVPGAQFAEAAAQAPPSELTSYFNAHKEQFRLPEQREVAYVMVETAKLLPQVKEDEAAMRGWYEDHKQEFSTEEQVQARHILVKVDDQQNEKAARAKIEQARRRIEGGEAFAKVAGELSEDPGSKANGGDLGFFGRGQMVPQFEEAAFGAQPGTLVGPVRSDFGYHLIEVTDKRPGGQRTFEEVRAEVASRLAGERVREIAETRAKDVAKKLADDKPKGPQDLEALAKQDPALTYALSGKIGRNDPVPGIGMAPPFNGAAFELAKGGVSEPVEVPRGWAVLYLKDVYEPRLPELAEIEPRVRQAVAQQKQQQLAMDRLRQARAGGQTLEQVAQQLGVEVQESQEFGRQGFIPGLGMSPELAQAALALQPGQVGGPMAAGPGAVLFEVVERKAWDPKQFAANREATRTRLEQEQVDRLIASLLEQRRRELDVQYDRELLESLGVAEVAES